MHIPSGFLEPQVWGSMTVISMAGTGLALKKSGELIEENKAPVMGVMAAFIFAAQMVNFPVLGGTSGHLLGSALAVAVLGMWPAMVVMTSVVIIQSLLFQDGGIEALGANIFNMSIISCLISGLIIDNCRKYNEKIFYFSVAFAAWLSVVVASILCALELSLSGTSPLKIVLPAMIVIHTVIGAFEGFITISALRFIAVAAVDKRYFFQMYNGGRS